MKKLFIGLFVLCLSGQASAAACAETVSQAKGNGVYQHFLKLTGGRTWLKLRRQNDGQQVEAGVSGDNFSVLGFNVTICINGANGIKATAGSISGTVTKSQLNGKTVYVVVAPGGYSGNYFIDQAFY